MAIKFFMALSYAVRCEGGDAFATAGESPALQSTAN